MIDPTFLRGAVWLAALTGRKRRLAVPPSPRPSSAWISGHILPAALVTWLGLLSAGWMCAGLIAEPASPATPSPATPEQVRVVQSPPAQPATSEPSATQTAPAETALVTQVVDGDTIDVMVGGQELPVRYIGIDSPERGDVCFAQATTANARLVEGQQVRLVRDVSERDRYDRLLRYVYVGDLFVNAILVEQGYARAVSFPPDTLHLDQFRALEAQAKAAGLGCHPTGVFDPPPLATQPGQAGCDPAYPTVCIPPYPPDLDCDEIGFRQFEVLPPDPHRFDGNGDGVGCPR